MTDTLRPDTCDTEYEDDAEDQQEPPYEVEEELEEDAADYAPPEENKDIWKNFGYESEAGRALRRLYAGTNQKAAASRVSYPRLVSPARRWEPQAAAQKQCPQRAHVNAPRSMRPTIDRDDPKYWRMPVPGRKPAEEILAEMQAHKQEKPNLKKGRDQVVEKQNLQDKFHFCGGKMMPSGAMGHVPKGKVPNIAEVRREMPERWDHIDDTGLTKEQRDMFCEITTEIQDKQKRLAELDAQGAAEAKPGKQTTVRNRESLQLQNDIQRCVKDMDRLLQISDD